MNYQKTFFFIGQCLTINAVDENKKNIEEQLKNNSINWDTIVKVSTANFVFPALYCNLKRANFLHYLPEELVEYMSHITNLNRERNQQIIEQAKEINELLLAHNISPIFLKGTAHLLEGLYDDIAERMVGDIDFIVSKQDYLKTIQIFKNNKYATHKDDKIIRSFHWHYPKLIHPNKIAAVEIHNKILKKPYHHIFKEQDILKTAVIKSNYCFFSSNYKVLNAILPKIINDNLYYSHIIPLRTMYDVFLLTKNKTFKVSINDKKVFKKYNNYLSCIKLVLNNPDTIIVEDTKTSKKYQKNYLLKLHGSKKLKVKTAMMNQFLKLKNYLFMVKMSFVDQEYRAYTTQRILQMDFYKNLLGYKKTVQA